MFNPFRQLTQAFIMTFGVTPPRPEQEVRATLFICGMLFGLLALVVAVVAPHSGVHALSATVCGRGC